MQKQKQPLDFFSDGATKQQWVEGGRKKIKKFQSGMEKWDCRRIGGKDGDR